MTEKEVVEGFSFQDCKHGLETLDALVFSEYQKVCERHINPPTEDVVETRVTELEQALTAIRFLRQLLDQIEMSDSELQEMVGGVQVQTASSKEIIETSELVTEILDAE